MKKKVGIITMHKVFNYGSALQAYALQHVIEKLGFNAELIDYEYPTEYHTSLQKSQNAKEWLAGLVGKIFVMMVRPLLGISIQKHQERFLSFYENFFKLSEQKYLSQEDIHANPPKYDIYVTGSDQVWNPKYIGNDTSFMLSFVKEPALKIAYSASFATNRIDDALKEMYADCLKEYQFLSTREKMGGDLLKGLIDRESEIVVDPTLLLTGDEWAKIAETSDLKIDKPYILAYILSYAFDPYPYVADLIRHVQRETGLAVVLLSVSNRRMWFGKNTIRVQNAGPSDFVNLFKNASFVITTSFHGTAFALNFEKPFYALLDNRPTGNDRIGNLLELTGTLDRGIKKMSDYPTEFSMNYDKISHNLNLLRGKSVDYLKRAL